MGMTMQGDERQLLEMSATLRRGALDITDGRLTITNQRLHFAPGPTLIGDRTSIEISISEIAAVTPQRRFGILPCDIDVVTHSGRVLHFQALWGGKRARVLEALREANTAHKGAV